MTAPTWVLESGIFPSTHEPLRSALKLLDIPTIEWSDAWLSDGVPSRVPTDNVVFHGSLGNAAWVQTELGWTPGSFCPVDAFRCTSWYADVEPWLLNPNRVVLPARELVERAADVAAELGAEDALFVRPDSPLKPFSGRVVPIAGLSLETLDHGFYFTDEMLPVIAAPVCSIEEEWRFVVLRKRVITGSGYDAGTRTAVSQPIESEAGTAAIEIAASFDAPADVYVMDLCRSAGEIRLVELNPFGGADLYACDAGTIVRAISHLLRSTAT